MRKLKLLTMLAILLPAIALTLSACGGGGGTTSAVTAPTTTGTPSVAAKTSALAAGDADCPSGGILVETGVDSNKNNILEADEVSKSQKVCNGAPGAAGTQGTAGLQGATGATGAQGTNGTDGLYALVKLSQEVVGTNCLTGGVRIDSGMDTSTNGILDTSEITSTSFTCNGATGATGPASSGVTWVNVTGTTQQAASNTGYMADSSSQVTITLPVSPSLGDTVQVTGVGVGGWKIAQNAGQSIMTKNLLETYGAVWTPHGSARNWTSVASSSDGTKLVAAAIGIGSQDDFLYTSTDSGTTWTARDSARNWYSVASSSDGAKLVAVAYNDQIYTSTDSGVSWTPRESARYWESVASSSDGTKLVAVASSGQIYTSTDSGVIWTPRESARSWSSVASSSDGTKLVAGAGLSGSGPSYDAGSGLIYTSTDSGVTWTPRSLVETWFSVASSSDGTKLVAVGSYSPSTAGSGQIYTSTDSGVNWTPRGFVGTWSSVASSSDGTRLVAVAGTAGWGPSVISGQIYSSTDSGVTWTQRGLTRAWASAASSSDGTKLVAVASNYTAGNGNGLIYTSAQQTSTGIGGSISGGQYDAIDLQYIGNNMFTVLSRMGTIQ